MSLESVCWKCGAPLPSFDRGKVPFRETCERCDADLHTCKNCLNWAPGKPNECLIPGTDYVADRERANFCEEFRLRGTKPPAGPSKDDIAKRLFGD